MYLSPFDLEIFTEERYARLSREAQIRRLCHRYRMSRTLWIQRWRYRVLGVLGQAMIRVGQRWAAYELSQRVSIHRAPPAHVQQT